jgi:hypothetical protein
MKYRQATGACAPVGRAISSETSGALAGPGTSRSDIPNEPPRRNSSFVGSGNGGGSCRIAGIISTVNSMPPHGVIAARAGSSSGSNGGGGPTGASSDACDACDACPFRGLRAASRPTEAPGERVGCAIDQVRAWSIAQPTCSGGGRALRRWGRRRGLSGSKGLLWLEGRGMVTGLAVGDDGFEVLASGERAGSRRVAGPGDVAFLAGRGRRRMRSGRCCGAGWRRRVGVSWLKMS